MTKEDNAYLQVALDEMRKTFDLQLGSFDTIKATVRALLGSASLIVGLVSTLQIFSPATFAPMWLPWYQIGLGAAGVFYVILIVFCSMALWPAVPVLPVAAEWDELVTTYKGLSENERLAKQLSAILNAMDLNRPKVQHYAFCSRAASFLLPVIVTILLLLALIPRT